MGKMPPSAAAELAVQATELISNGQSDCEARVELAEWISENLDDEGALRQAKLSSKAAGAGALAYFSTAVRLVSGTLEISTEGVREYVVLFTMPIFISGDPRPDGARHTDWGGRAIVERYMESALGLRMLSVRLSAFPVEPVPLSQLSATQQKRFVMDLHTYGDSRLVAPAPLVFDGEETGLVWAGIVKFRVDSYVEEFTRFREGISSPKIAKFRSFASRELVRCLIPMATNPVVTVYPPIQMAYGFSRYRVIKLHRLARRVLEEKPHVRSLIYRLKSNFLTLWFIGPDGTFEDVAELDFTEDDPFRVYDALRYLQKKTGITLQEVHEMPVLPGQTAGNSR